MTAWVQNADKKAVAHWRNRGELALFAFGVKAYMRRKWDVDSVGEGPPVATKAYSADELVQRGVVGLYAERIHA